MHLKSRLKSKNAELKSAIAEFEDSIAYFFDANKIFSVMFTKKIVLQDIPPAGLLPRAALHIHFSNGLYTMTAFRYFPESPFRI